MKIANASLLLEGPLPKERGSWLVAARKSYLRYLIDLVTDDEEIGFGFRDIEARVAYELTPRQRATLSVVDGFSSLDDKYESAEPTDAATSLLIPVRSFLPA